MGQFPRLFYFFVRYVSWTCPQVAISLKKKTGLDSSTNYNGATDKS